MFEAVVKIKRLLLCPLLAWSVQFLVNRLGVPLSTRAYCAVWLLGTVPLSTRAYCAVWLLGTVICAAAHPMLCACAASMWLAWFR